MGYPIADFKMKGPSGKSFLPKGLWMGTVPVSPLFVNFSVIPVVWEALESDGADSLTLHFISMSSTF